MLILAIQMESKGNDKDILNLIAEYAKTSNSDISSNEINKVFTSLGYKKEKNNNIIIIPDEHQESENENENSFTSSDIINQFEALKTAVEEVSKSVENFHAKTLEVVNTRIKTEHLNLQAKMDLLEQKISEIHFKVQSVKFLAEDSKNIIATTKSQASDIRNLKSEIVQLSNVVKLSKENTPPKNSNESFLEIKNKLSTIDYQLALLSNNQMSEKETIPKWFIFSTIAGILAMSLLLFIFILKTKTAQKEMDSKENLQTIVPENKMPVEQANSIQNILADTITKPVQLSNAVAKNIEEPFQKNELKQSSKRVENVAKSSVIIHTKNSNFDNHSEPTKKNDKKNVLQKNNSDVYFGND